jgi:hypothetical protein
VKDKGDAKTIVLSYLASKREAFLKEADKDETKTFTVTPHVISRYAEAEVLHNKPFCKPLQYSILKYLDFLREEPWVVSAHEVRLDVNLSDSGVSKIEYKFMFKKNITEVYDEENNESVSSTDVSNTNILTSG